MGIFSWLFGRVTGQSQKPEPHRSTRRREDPGGEIAWDFRKSERPADHKWRWWIDDVGGPRVASGIAGIKHREAVVRQFVREARRSEQSGSRYGILLQREPNNPVDPNAIRVLGWTGDPARATELGYLYREDSALVAKEFPSDMPLAAELWRVYSPSPEKLWVGIRLLIPAKRDAWWRQYQHTQRKDT